MPTELNLTVSLYWDGLMGLNNWVGFGLAAIYYLGTDYGFGLTFCEITGYAYYVIDGMNYIVQFAAPVAESANNGGSIADIAGAVAQAGAEAAQAAGVDLPVDAAAIGNAASAAASGDVGAITNAVTDVATQAASAATKTL